MQPPDGIRVSAAVSPSSADARNALLAGFLGWTFDAFDFFVLTFVLVPVAREFHRGIPQMAVALSASMITRPLGALIFGLLADRYGRRLPLMLDIVFYSVVEVLSGLAPGYKTFLALRLLYGIGMGGEWGVGASLAMESVPAKWRGVLSGALQEGYPLGNLLAALAYGAVFPRWGWRPLFFIGGLPALLALFIRARVRESEAWRTEAAAWGGWRAYARGAAANGKRFAYLVLLLAMMNFMSHGTQDLFPTFLQQRHFATHAVSLISVISMIGALAGGIMIGFYSDRAGRRRAMAGAAIAAALVIPAWILAPGVSGMALGAFAMQFLVQGAWGVVPAHINELSPGALRAFFPGFAYQTGALVAAATQPLEARLAGRFGYAAALGGFAGLVLLAGALVISFGPENHRAAFGKSP